MTLPDGANISGGTGLTTKWDIIFKVSSADDDFVHTGVTANQGPLLLTQIY